MDPDTPGEAFRPLHISGDWDVAARVSSLSQFRREGCAACHQHQTFTESASSADYVFRLKRQSSATTQHPSA